MKRARVQMAVEIPEITKQQFDTHATEVMAAARARRDEAMEERFVCLINVIRDDTFITAMAKILQGDSVDTPMVVNSATDSCEKCESLVSTLPDGQRMECWCDIVWCKNCSKPLKLCECESPWIFSKYCVDCGGEHGLCGCGVDASYTLQPFIIEESMHQCKVCMSFANGDEMVPCDAEECLLPCPGLAHEACLTQVAHQAYPDGAFLCHLCIDAENVPFVDEGTSDDEAESSGD